MLHGRAAESAVLGGVLDSARDGNSGVLVVRGEAGIGKSALLGAVDAEGFRVLRGTAIESESVVPYAGLSLLLRCVSDGIDVLPPRQAATLRIVLGDGECGDTDPYHVGVALLALLAELAERQPVLCLVDDAHWLDQGSAFALLFAARRLRAESVAVVFAARDLHAPPFPAPGVPELRLTALSDDDAFALLAEHAADLPRHVRERIAREAAGNPLALLELPAAQREGHLTAGPAHPPATLPAHSRVRRMFADRIAALPERTRTLLLVAAADDTGDPGVVFPAAERLGASVADLEPAEQRQLLRSDDGRIAFRHPLVRTAAYRGASLVGRIDAHRALAGVVADETRRTWHLAAATTSPDEDVARALERLAETARKRGGSSAVLAAYHRAAELTPDPKTRGRRLTLAAAAAVEAGHFDRASALADSAADLLRDPLEYAKVARVWATLAGERGESAEAATILGKAAHCAATGDPDLASELLFTATQNAWTARDFTAVRGFAEQASGLPGAHRVKALARAAIGLDECDVPDTLAAMRELVADPREDVTRAWWHLVLGDDRAAYDHAATVERRARASGALGPLPRALAYLARARLNLGQPREARETAEEGLRIAADIGQGFSVGFLSCVLAEQAALAGDERRVAELVGALGGTGGPPTAVRAMCASALLDLGLGRPEAVLERLADVGAARLYAIGSLPDLVEAAVRVGEVGQAKRAADWYAEWADGTGHDWALAVADRCRALVTDEERYYLAARDRHRSPARPFERARTELLYGEWLRRERRRVESRVPLRSAAETFERLGATPWAERARQELRATGESRPAPGPDPVGALTPQELQVVRLAAAGLSNRDIADRLFLSPRTVGYHLYKAYPKLGVASRGELARVPL
ncbi:LuxR family transcriptional regulator [Saccharothrix violaceirubra]